MPNDTIENLTAKPIRADMRRDARALFAAGEYENACVIAEDITTEYGDTPIDLVFLAGCLRQNQNDIGAEIVLQRCIEAAPDHAPARLALAQIYAQREDYPAAVTEAKTSLEYDPGSMKAAMLLGWLNRKTGDLANEQRAFAAAAKIAPTSMSAQMSLAQVSMRLDDSDVALTAVKAALAQEPENDRALTIRARIQTERRKQIRALQMAKHNEQALAAAGQLIQDFGETTEDAASLAECLGAVGNIDTAQSIMTAALTLEPENAKIRLTAAKWFGENGAADRAIEEAETVLRLDKTSEAAALLIGQLQRRSGNIDGEHWAFTRATEINPQSTRALAGLAAAAQRKGDLPDALMHSDAALANDPEFPLALRIRAVVLASIGQPIEDQKAAFESALAAAPKDILLLRTYADAMERAGDIDSAVNIMSRIESVTDDPYQHTRFLARNANMLAKTGATDDAKGWAIRAAEAAAGFNRERDVTLEIGHLTQQAIAAGTTPPDIPFERAILAAAATGVQSDGATWALQRMHFGRLAASWSVVATQSGPDQADPWGDVIDISDLIAFQKTKGPGPAMLVGGHIGPPVVLQNSFSRYAPDIHCLSSNAAFWLSRKDSSGFILAALPNQAALTVFDRLSSGATVFVGADGMLGARGLHGEAFGFRTNWAAGAATLARKTSAVVYGCHALWDGSRIKIAITPGFAANDAATDEAWLKTFGDWYGDLLEGILRTDPANYRPASYRYFGLES